MFFKNYKIKKLLKSYKNNYNSLASLPLCDNNSDL